jgi:hypothetical protein
MELPITTPALLFPAISLLMISYTARFLHLANLARSLHATKAGVPFCGAWYLGPRARR